MVRYLWLGGICGSVMCGSMTWAGWYGSHYRYRACRPFHPPDSRSKRLIREAGASSYFSSYSSMDHDGSIGWRSLGQDLQISILSELKHEQEKGSMRAMMYTSRNRRLLASSLISSIKIRDASALSKYPRHTMRRAQDETLSRAGTHGAPIHGHLAVTGYHGPWQHAIVWRPSPSHGWICPACY